MTDDTDRTETVKRSLWSEDSVCTATGDICDFGGYGAEGAWQCRNCGCRLPTIEERDEMPIPEMDLDDFAPEPVVLKPASLRSRLASVFSKRRRDAGAGA